MHSTAFFIVAVIAMIVEGLAILVFLFQPGLRYRILEPDLEKLSPEDFLRTLEVLTESKLLQHNSVEVLTNGECFYESELDAIANAQRSVNLEAYIFQKGEVGGRYLRLLTEKAQAGVRVKLLLDAVGSAGIFKSELKRLRDAGGKFAWYHPLWPSKIFGFNNRTHRELLVVDGRVGFIGGAGIADHWLLPSGKKPRWRDTMFRVEGEVVSSLHSVFAENWLEATDDVIVGPDYFDFTPAATKAPMLVISSTPSAGDATRARLLFQLLIASAKKSILITTPYFLPDHSARQELLRARRRGVDVRIVTPGAKSDHWQTRRSSRRHYGDLLKQGAQIFEYQPSMIHAKIMIVDGMWCVVGSTNFDSRSFQLNDEVNLAVCDRQLADRLRDDFARDVAQCHEVTYDEWKHRPIIDRLDETVGIIFERQQ
jgi:cardiolipin synthase